MAGGVSAIHYPSSPAPPVLFIRQMRLPHTMFHVFQAERVRAERSAAERQAWFAAQQAMARRKATGKTEVDRAIAAAKAFKGHVIVSHLLETLGSTIEPDSAQPGLRVRIDLVRSRLANPLDALATGIHMEATG